MSKAQVDITVNETAELACTYAALILNDDNVKITADKIKTLITAAGIDIPAFWPSLFAKALENKKVDDIVLSGGSGGATTTVAAPVAHAEVAEKKDDAKGGKKDDKKAKKEEPKEEEDTDMGFGLFD